MSNIIDSIRLSGTTYQIQGSGGGITVDPTLDSGSTNPVANSAITTAIDDKQDTLVSGTNIKTINNESILGSGNIDIQGGGKAIEAGRGISITTGATADTVSFNLPISAGTGSNSIIEGNGTKASGFSSHAEGSYSKANGSYSHAEGFGAKANGSSSHAEGGATNADGSYSHAEGDTTTAKGNYSHTEGRNTIANNLVEHASGQYNNSVTGSSTFGDSGNTLFSVGNGTADNARHNAFEIRQNGDIYLTKDGQDVKLQDQLGGGGSSYTAGDGIDITNDVISVTGKADTSAVTEVSDALTAHTANTTVHTTAAEKSSWNGAATNASNALMALGGLSLVKLTQAEYDALSPNYDSNTLYVIVN